MMLFFVGILEMIVITSWTNVVTKTKVVASGLVTLLNVLIWYYVVQSIVTNIHDWHVAFLYALGCAVGSMLGTYYFAKLHNRINRLAKKMYRGLRILTETYVGRRS